MESMKITVVLCTYNRHRSLTKALESIAQSTLPDYVQWEVLVVDNNSNDPTRSLIESFCQKYPGRFRYLFESQQGKSHALNAGVAQALGGILVFTDDDVRVEPTWLYNLTAALHNGEWAGVGGRTLPERAFEFPRWLRLDERYALAPLALFDRDSDSCELNEAPFGNNMAYRKVMFEKHGNFRIDLGPSPERPGPQKSEDSEFGCRLLAAGERLKYEPSAVIYHAVEENRVRQSYFLSWWFDKQRADIRAFGTPPNVKWFVEGIPLYLFRRIAVWTLRWIMSVNRARRFSNKCKVWGLAGEIVECYQQARRE
jgi:glycosyltransferase involved in cell wall biosynthesis